MCSFVYKYAHCTMFCISTCNIIKIYKHLCMYIHIWRHFIKLFSKLHVRFLSHGLSLCSTMAPLRGHECGDGL